MGWTDDKEMNFGFMQDRLKVETFNGRDDVLLEPLLYKSKSGSIYRVPTEASTDGMSTPRIAQLIPGFEPTGDHWFSAVLHDAAYRGTLQIFRWTCYVPANLTRAEADDLIREALESQGVRKTRRNIVRGMLALFGGPNFKPLKS